MGQWVRRIRGAVGIGLTWGAAWLAVGLILLLIVGPDAADVPFPLFFGFLGFLAGVTFSAILGILGRRRRFEQMSLPRFVGWGAIGAALLAAVVDRAAGPSGDLPALAALFAGAGAVSASGTLLLARRAERRGLSTGDPDAFAPTADRRALHERPERESV